MKKERQKTERITQLHCMRIEGGIITIDPHVAGIPLELWEATAKCIPWVQVSGAGTNTNIS